MKHIRPSTALGASSGIGSRRFCVHPPEIRKVIYITNATESLNNSIHSLMKNRRAFPNDKALRRCSI
ncbi:MAG: transposase [Candidatus Latescibacteria bacterium]|jgi:transposase-like protein|nr:transposase [Candidatus Latescibacterota bacterium]